MEKNFEPILQFILTEEGGFVVDHAGATRIGLTVGLMKALKMDLDHDGDVDADDVKLVDGDLVRKVFREQFWNRYKGRRFKVNLLFREILRKARKTNGF